MVCMKLVEIRKQNGLTQKEAATLIGVPYRTYLRYEESDSYLDSFKYRMMVEDLSNKLRIDEEHGVLSLDKIKSLLLPILDSKKITKCYLFGSYAKKSARENSDVDLLVDTDITGLDFLNLVEELRDTLHKKVDLLRLSDLQSNNPIILEVLKEGIRLL